MAVGSIIRERIIRFAEYSVVFMTQRSHSLPIVSWLMVVFCNFVDAFFSRSKYAFMLPVQALDWAFLFVAKLSLHKMIQEWL